MAITSAEFVNRVLSHYNDRANWTYCHGSTGYVVGAPDNKVKNYYEYFLRIGKNSTNIPYPQWLAEHNGKKTCDCSNFINLLIFGDYCNSNWSTGSFTKMEQLTNPIPGAIAWKDGHVGICVAVDASGNGTYIHMPYYERTFEKFTDNEDQWHPKSYWKGYCKLPSSYVTYSATPTPTESIPKSITATVNGKYKVGKILTATDFTVKVTMSNGAILTNPPYWTATPLTLTSTSNIITVAYKNVSTKITVPAEAESPVPTPAPATPAASNKTVSYKVFVGDYNTKVEADKALTSVKASGFPGYVTKNTNNNKFVVQVGYYTKKTNADNMNKKLKAKGYNSYLFEVIK